MKNARGEVKKMLLVIGEIQFKAGKAKGLHDDDRSQAEHEEAQRLLEEVQVLCVNATSEYYPLD